MFFTQCRAWSSHLDLALLIIFTLHQERATVRAQDKKIARLLFVDVKATLHSTGTSTGTRTAF